MDWTAIYGPGEAQGGEPPRSMANPLGRYLNYRLKADLRAKGKEKKILLFSNWLHREGLIEAHVINMSEVWEVLKTGSNARAVGATNANEHSSRSHCIHCVMVKGENMLNGECTRSKLWLVDLAGSERVAKTEVQGECLKETQNINRSLSALGGVISALATKSPHIPFRNSKLTHLLQDSLGGDSKTLMFMQISPNESDLGETLCSLNFASRVKGVELCPAKRQLHTSKYLRYKPMVKELEAQLLVERKLARQHVDTKIAATATNQISACRAKYSTNQATIWKSAIRKS